MTLGFPAELAGLAASASDDKEGMLGELASEKLRFKLTYGPIGTHLPLAIIFAIRENGNGDCTNCI